MAAGGKITILDNGKFGIADSGKVDVCDDADCCACEYPTCEGSAITATYAGVDAAVCTGCKTIKRFPGGKGDINTLSIDGAYSSIPFISETAGVCLWLVSGISGLLTIDQWSDASCTALVGPYTPGGQIVVFWDTVNCRFKEVFDTFPTDPHNAFHYDQAVDGGSFGFGDAIPNGQSCDSSLDHLSSGGTVTITLT